MTNHLSQFFSSKPSLYIGLVFSSNSIVFGNWITRIASMKETIGLSDAALGMALLGAPLGSLLVLPASGWLISKLQLGRTVVLGGIMLSLSLPFLAFADSFWTLTAALAYFGFANSIMNISMNAAASAIERQSGKPILTTCHGMWSVGGMVGSGVGSILLGVDMDTKSHLILISIVTFLVILFFSNYLVTIKEGRKSGEKVFAVPKGSLLYLSIIAFCILLSEGAIADWSAVYMKEVVRTPPYLYGLAYSGFAFCMTIGRLFGDGLIPNVGKKNIVIFGGCLSSFGLAGAILLHQIPVTVILGFALTGLGFSCVVPVLYISAANTPGYASGAGIAAVSILGSMGFLMGPPIIGLLSEHFSLQIGMLLVLFCSLMVSIVALAIKFR